jgi:hypothetical protein
MERIAAANVGEGESPGHGTSSSSNDVLYSSSTAGRIVYKKTGEREGRGREREKMLWKTNHHVCMRALLKVFFLRRRRQRGVRVRVMMRGASGMREVK